MIPDRTFFMLRHGETVMNAKRLTCGGGIDTILNDEGRRQAHVASKVLAAIPADQRPTLIIHSDMNRTVETTAILNAELQLPVLKDNSLREHMFGEWENKAWEEVFPYLHSDNKPVGGESRREFGTRVIGALNRHLTEHASERVLFVVHGGTFHSFQLMHGRDRRVFIPNATLHRFDPEPAHQPMPWRVTSYDWKNALRESPASICPSQPDPAK